MITFHVKSPLPPTRRPTIRVLNFKEKKLCVCVRGRAYAGVKTTKIKKDILFFPLHFTQMESDKN